MPRRIKMKTITMLLLLVSAVVLVGALMIAGCSSVNNKEASIDPDTGNHIGNWYVNHRAAVSTDFTQCSSCHGANLGGGISKVSCFSATFNGMSCHGHPSGWASPDTHGAAAKAAPNALADTGFSSCRDCHGSSFSGGILSSQTCLNTCHTVAAPHSPAPWRTIGGVGRTHTNTDPANANVCAFCHTNGANSTVQPSPPAPPATLPGCFNNTLCHAQAGHPAGWASPDSHGAAAKDAPDPVLDHGFSSCQACHGANFAGGGTNPTCLNTAGCHGATVAAPHSPAPWRAPLTVRTHTTTNTANATVCALCHAGQSPTPAPPGTSPGCFNNTLCHGQAGAPHAVPFTDPVLHGPPAKADLTYCESCHANPSNGGPGSNPRFNVAIGRLATGCEGCHTAFYAHPPQWRGLTATAPGGHMTASNLSTACVLCHGVNLAGGVGAACSTCHTAGSPVTLTNCTSCHSSPPTGASAPNQAGSHAKHNALVGVTGVCNTCHNGGGTRTANHDYGRGSVFAAFLATYNAKTGAASFNAGANTCSNVSCHGGQTTPNWLTGTINVNTQCTSCHISGTTQFNSYNSGEHNTHVNGEGFACTVCHDTTKLAVVHFNDLNTTAMTQSNLTLLNALNYNATNRTCNPSAITGCHGSRSW